MEYGNVHHSYLYSFAVVARYYCWALAKNTSTPCHSFVVIYHVLLMDLGDNGCHVAQGGVAKLLLCSGHYCFQYKHQCRRFIG